MKNKILILGLSIMLFGCVTSQEKVMEGFNAININDGIDKTEAKFIGKKYLLDHPTESENYVSTATVKDKGDYWKVVFPRKSLNIFSPKFGSSFLIYIDKATGKVEEGGTEVPFFMSRE